MWLTRLCIRYPVFTCMLMMSFIVMGTFSWQKLPVEEYPNVELPYVLITTYYPGATPAIIENDVTRPIEDAVNSVAGVKRIISTSYEGLSNIAIEFDLGIPINAALQDVRDKIARVKVDFRDDIEEPLIERFRLDEAPVVSLAFTTASGDNTALSTHITQQVVQRLQNISGVGSVVVVGDQTREIQVLPQTDKMAALGIGVNDLITALRNENIQVPVGALDQGNTELSVEIAGRFKTPSDFAHLIVAKRGPGIITLGQVATIEDGAKEQQSLALLDGQRAIGLNIIKNSGANIIALVNAVKERLPAIQNDLPDGAQMQLVADSSTAINASLKDVKKTLIEGMVLAIFIVFLFLGSWRSTVITGLTLPVALAGTVFVLYLFDLSLNNMTLMAMSLSIGLLIDDAIVVRENIVRHTALGKDHHTASIDGTREIGLAVLATTLTIVAVFLPVAFMGGIIGRFFYQFGIAVSCAVLLSMLVSFTLDPMLSSRWRDPDAHGIQGNSWLARQVRGFQNGLEKLTSRYALVIRWALAHRRTVLLLALSSLLLAAYTTQFIGKEFVPESDMNELSVKFSTPVGSSLAWSEAKSRQINQLLLDLPGVTNTYTTLNTGMDIGKHKAAIRVKLLPKNQRNLSQQDTIELVRTTLSRVHGITLNSVTPVKETLGSLKPIQVSLQGNDPQQLKQLARQFEQRLNTIPGLIDLESSAEASKPAMSLQIDRARAADLGLTLSQIGFTLRPLLAGETITSWQAPDGENYDVMVRLPEAQRHHLSSLSLLPLTTSKVNLQTGQPDIITLNQFSYFDKTTSAAQINRRNLLREVLFSANASGRPAGDVGEDIEQIAAQMNLPAGFQIVTQGANKDMKDSVAYATTALLLGILLIYMILATQFNSFLHPLTIMTSLPLSLVGVFLALLLCGSSLNMFSIIGIIMLMGLVTKNAILLVDLIQRLARDGMALNQAIETAGQTRLRPILMTTAAMIAGMLPLALELGTGAEARAPMAHALIGGLITSTLLTLIVVPVVYSYLDGAKQYCLHLLAGQPTPQKPVLSLAWSADSVTPLDTDTPPGKDYVGMWYTARLQQGFDDKMLFGVYKKFKSTPIWYSLSHQHYDGIGAMADKIAPLSGYPPTDGMPQGRDTRPPSINAWRKANKLPLHAPKAEQKWRHLLPELQADKAPMPNHYLLSKDDTLQADAAAEAAGVNTTVWLLWTADRALRQHLVEPDTVTSWVYPVNLRGATRSKRESMNQCGGFMITISQNMSATDVYAQVKNRLTRLEHWKQWWLMNIGRWVGQAGVNLIYRLLNNQPGQFTGSYSNIGSWHVPVLTGLIAAAPCAPSYPVSISTAACSGRRSLSVRLHPVVNQDEQVSKALLSSWRDLALKKQTDENYQQIA